METKERKYVVNDDKRILKKTGLFLFLFVIGIISGIIGSVFYIEYNKEDLLINNEIVISNDNNIEIYGENKVADKKIDESIVDSIVAITLKNEVSSVTTNEYVDIGTGIVYSDDGYIISCYEVFEKFINSNYEVYITTSEKERIKAEVYAVDKSTNIVVLKVNKSLKKAEFSTEVNIGDTVYLLGNELGSEYKASILKGSISNKDIKMNVDGVEQNLISTDIISSITSVGGALVNSNGKVIGINYSNDSIESYYYTDFAISYSSVENVIKSLIENKKVIRPFIGIYAIDVTETVAEQLKIDVGILVNEVIEDTPAYIAGIKANDYITHIDGKKVMTMEELNNYKNTKNPKDEVILKIKRDGKELELKLILGSEADYAK